MELSIAFDFNVISIEAWDEILSSFLFEVGEVVDIYTHEHEHERLSLVHAQPR